MQFTSACVCRENAGAFTYSFGAGVGRLFSQSLRLVELVRERTAAAGEFGGRVHERLALGLGGGAPLGEFGDLGVGALAPFIPGAAFGGDRKGSEVDHEAREAALYQQIGKLQMELDWLKKKVAQLG